jgi:hypothetical protein
LAYSTRLEVGCLDRMSNLLRQRSRLTGVGARQQEHKLLAAETSGEVSSAVRMRQKDVAKPSENFVARLMAIRIVQLLKAVDVKQKQGQVPSFALRPPALER